ncbi:Gamma-glutamylputrescine oxidoreductase [Mycena kentingensis (nom. inval.)]|nr:Gamma-glutamylputrescine oxidoreductase [Mycena kentingensis (nom. inval.)]
MRVCDAIPLQQMDATMSAFLNPDKPPQPAALPSPNPTRSFWIDTPGANPLAAEGSTGTLPQDADVCIIGSGITGVSAAYHLSQAARAGEPLKVVILEARDFCERFLLASQLLMRKYGTAFSGVEFGGHNLWPLKFVTRLFQLTKDALPALSLHTRTPVTSISSPGTDSSGWVLTTPRGKITTKYIIHATNAYASHLLPQLARPDTGIIPTRGQVIATRAAVRASELFTCSWDGNTGFEYWFPRPTAAGASSDAEKPRPLIILGGGREAEAPRFEFGVTDDSSLGEHAGRVLRNFLPAVYPGKFEQETEPEMEWTGIMGFTKSRDPIVGHVPGLPGQYISAGYSGHGMPRAFSCASIVASMVACEMDGSTFELPEWFPSAYLSSWTGLNNEHEP